MELKEIIENLDQLKAIVEEDWDLEDEETKNESDRFSKALNAAIKILESDRTVGTLIINNNTYIVKE